MAKKRVAELDAKMKLDSKQFSQALARIKTNMSTMSTHITDRNRTLRSSFNSVAKSAEDMAKRIKAAQMDTADAYKKVAYAAGDMRTSNTDVVNGMVKDLKKARIALGTLTNEVNKAFKPVVKSIQKVSTELAELGTVSSQVKLAAAAAPQAIETAAKEAHQEVKKLQASMRSLSKSELKNLKYDTGMAAGPMRKQTKAGQLVQQMESDNQRIKDLYKQRQGLTTEAEKKLPETLKPKKQMKGPTDEDLLGEAFGAMLDKYVQTGQETPGMTPGAETRKLRQQVKDLEGNLDRKSKTTKPYEDKPLSGKTAADVPWDKHRVPGAQKQYYATDKQVKAEMGPKWQSSVTSTNMQAAAKEAQQTLKGVSNQVQKTAATHNSAVKSMRGNITQLERSWWNIKRMIIGITFAQSFYKGLNAVQAMTSGMWEMAKSIEQVEASFTTLTGSNETAVQLAEQVQDYANKSAFTFQSATKAAQTLLAYGFEVENLMYMLETVGNASAAIGSEEAFGRVAKALGQINTKGRLATQEVLQLTEAGIPAYEILEEKLGLTKEQLGELGKVGIDANVALMALTEGINERFGGAMAMMNNTITGLQSNIRDTLSYVGAEAMKPLKDIYKGHLRELSETLTEMVSVVRSSGVGGLFEAFVSPELHEPIRQLIANLHGLVQSFQMMWAAAAPIRQEFTILGINMLNLVVPAFQAVNTVLSIFDHMVSRSAFSMRVLTSVAMGAIVFVGVSKALRMTSDAMKLISVAAGPLMTLAKTFITTAKTAGIATAAVAAFKAMISGGFGLVKIGATVAAVGTAIAGMTGMFGSLSKGLGNISGNDASKYLQPTFEDAADGAGKFNKNLAETNEGLEEAGDKTDDLGKKAKEAGKKAQEALMSFDEVFKIDDPDETKTPDAGGGGGLGDFDVPDFGGGNVGLPTMPDFSGFVEEYTKNFDEAMKNKFRPDTRYYRDMWDNIKMGFKAGIESIGGILQLGSQIFYIPYKILQGVFASILTLFDGDTTTLKGIWSGVWADIRVLTINGLSNLKAETSRGMKVVRESTNVDMQAITEVFETSLKTLPQITKENMGEAADTFSELLRGLDDDSLLILRGTSESMRLLFNNIRSDMSKDEAMKQFEYNLKMMASAGKLEAGALSKDIEEAMKKIKDSTITETTKMTRETEDLWNIMSHNASAKAEEMAGLVLGHMKTMDSTTVGTLKGLGGTWSKIFDGITDDSDLESAETMKLVTGNIATMKTNGVFDLNKMKDEAAAAFEKMAKDADKRTTELKNFVNTGTFDASVFAGANAKLLYENVMQAVDDLPLDTEEEMKDAKNRMVDQLHAAGLLTEDEAEQMKNGITGELKKTTGEVDTIFGIKLKAVIRDSAPALQDAALGVGKALGKGMLDGVWDKLSNTVFSWNWWWEKVKAGVQGALDAMNPLKQAMNAIDRWKPPKWEINANQYPSPIGPQPARMSLMSQGSIRGMGAGTVRSTADRASAEMIADQLARTMAGGLQMQTAVLANQVGSVTSARGGQNNSVTINAYAMDDSNVRVLLRRLRLEAEREKERTFNTQGALVL